METVHERIAQMEGRLGEQSLIFAGLTQGLAEVRQDMNARFAQVDARFAQLDAKLDQMRFTLETRIVALDVRIADLHRKSDARFKWIVGLLVSCLIGILMARFRP